MKRKSILRIKADKNKYNPDKKKCTFRSTLFYHNPLKKYFFMINYSYQGKREDSI
jgi:hypothetical protein